MRRMVLFATLFTMICATASFGLNVSMSGTNSGEDQLLIDFIQNNFEDITLTYGDFSDPANIPADTELLIIGRQLSSTPYGNASNSATFNALTIPVVCFTSYVARPDSDRWGWHSGGAEGGYDMSGAETAVTAAGAKVFGVPEGPVDWHDYEGEFWAAGGGTVGDGQILATVGGSILAAHWNAGDLSGTGVAFGGSRLLFNMSEISSATVMPNEAGQAALVKLLTAYTPLGGEVVTKFPDPADGATDIWLGDSILTWTELNTSTGLSPRYRVSLADSFEDINDGAVTSMTQDVNEWVLESRLNYGTTYYWRVDEANEINEWDLGPIWSFTTEPYSYILDANRVTITASSSSANSGSENIINTSGLDEQDLHATSHEDMWLSAQNDSEPMLLFAFDKPYDIDFMQVWNYNTSAEITIGWGIKDVVMEYSLDGDTWMLIEDVTQFSRAPGLTATAPTDTFDLNGISAQYLRISIQSNWGGLLVQYGLSEVRFNIIPTDARYPNPDAGSIETDPAGVLTWRPGRKADEHVVSLGTDPNVLGDGVTSSINQVDMTDLGVQLGQTYYWRVDEVNEQETPSVISGDLWSFSTTDHLVIDDFESYNNDAIHYKRVFQHWIDGAGYTNPVEFPGNGTGSFVGYNPEFGDIMEMGETHSGNQSMPFYFSGAGSQTDRTFAPSQDWTLAGVTSLVIYFHGSADSTGQLYAVINGQKVLYDGDAANLSLPLWTQWTIDLSSINTDLTHVTTLSIGVDGNAEGMILLDDIRLYAEVPVAPVQIWMEAESGIVASPMAVFTDNEEASGGSYVTVEMGNASTDNPPEAGGTVTYTFEAEAGTYTIDCLHIAPDGGTDSIWVNIEGAEVSATLHASGWIRSTLSNTSSWAWSTIDSMDGGGDVEFTLPTSGTHTLEVAYREAGALLDVFVIKAVE